MDMLPINALRTPTGALAALVPLFGPERAMPVPLADPSAPLSSFKVINDSISVSVAARLGIGSIFSGQVSASDMGFYFDAVAMTDQYVEKPLPDTTVLATRWGVGIRIVLRVTSTTANASLNFGLVGAAVELGQAHARYEVDGIGIGIDGLTLVLGELSSIGDFRYETYQKISNSLVPKLGALLTSKASTLQPQPMGVILAKPVDLVEISRSVYYAMVSIANGRSLSDALARSPLGLDRDAIHDVYVRATQTEDPTAHPSSDAEREAERWLAH
jgi:hypothetical protein